VKPVSDVCVRQERVLKAGVAVYKVQEASAKSSTEARHAARSADETVVGGHAHSGPRMSGVRRVAAKHSHARAEFGTTKRHHVFAT